MTYRDRSPYAVLPDPRRPVRLDGRDVHAAYRDGGSLGVLAFVEHALRSHVTGRASSPDEVRLLREWLADETEETVAHWLARLTRPEAPEAPEDVVQARPEEAVEAALLTCSVCSAPFTLPPGPRRGRPRSKCWTCSPERRP
jgi:hypothetical protein